MNAEILSTTQVGKDTIIIMKVSLPEAANWLVTQNQKPVELPDIPDPLFKEQEKKPTLKRKKKKSKKKLSVVPDVTTGDKIAAGKVYNNIKSHLEKNDKSAALASMSRMIERHGSVKVKRLFDVENLGHNVAISDTVHDFLVDEGFV